MSGDLEQWYGLFAVGLCVPVFVRLAVDYIQKNWPEAMKVFKDWRQNVKDDWEETKRIFGRIEHANGT